MKYVDIRGDLAFKGYTIEESCQGWHDDIWIHLFVNKKSGDEQIVVENRDGAIGRQFKEFNTTVDDWAG